MRVSVLLALGFVAVFIVTLTVVCGQQRSGIAKNDPKCGLNCLYVVLRTLGQGPDRISLLEKDLGLPGKDGYSLLQLRDVARSYGCNSECAVLTTQSLEKLPSGLEVIFHIKPGQPV